MRLAHPADEPCALPITEFVEKPPFTVGTAYASMASDCWQMGIFSKLLICKILINWIAVLHGTAQVGPNVRVGLLRTDARPDC